MVDAVDTQVLARLIVNALDKPDDDGRTDSKLSQAEMGGADPAHLGDTNEDGGVDADELASVMNNASITAALKRESNGGEDISKAEFLKICGCDPDPEKANSVNKLFDALIKPEMGNCDKDGNGALSIKELRACALASLGGETSAGGGRRRRSRRSRRSARRGGGRSARRNRARTSRRRASRRSRV